MDEKRLLALIFAPKARSPRKSGRQAVEGKPQRVKIYDFASRAEFCKEDAAGLFSGERRGNGMAQYFAARRNQAADFGMRKGFVHTISSGKKR